MMRSWGIAIAIASVQGIIVGATYSHVCKTIAEKFSTPGAVYYPGAFPYPERNNSSLSVGPILRSDGFKNLARHWASSSDEVPACVVMPHTVEGVGKTVRRDAYLRCHRELNLLTSLSSESWGGPEHLLL
jgi:hypothetical protein